MSYTKQTWQSGDTITATKLNHIEDGIAGGGVLVVNSVYDEQADKTTLDKTWQEIHDATIAVIVAETPIGDLLEYVCSRSTQGGDYVIQTATVLAGAIQESSYICESADDYPVLQED